ncbi:hypothetical protein Goari_022147 [Gossypium aridum]|uniref:Uncharacterized protein n=1 Tax=Gossypium aridum TaxID=34290 RepID=A0A7J8YNY8_GOSAI|nr:hypothetical protein [Gossypium aridum]
MVEPWLDLCETTGGAQRYLATIRSKIGS